jgi:hypothetical protein
MKVLMLLSLGLIATLAAALKFAPAAFHHVLKNETSTAFLYDSGLKRRGDPSEHSDFTLDEIASTCSAPSISHEHVYNNAVGKGRQLASAMIANSNALPNYLSKQGASPWDGELREELQTWGWAEDEAPDRCDFRNPVPDHSRSLGLQKAFASLVDVRGIKGIDPRPSTAGGRTVCHCIYHYNSPAVVNKPDYGQAWPPRNQQQYEVNGRLYMVSFEVLLIWKAYADMLYRSPVPYILLQSIMRSVSSHSLTEDRPSMQQTIYGAEDPQETSSRR